MNKISGVYKITNNITGDFYIGSSKNIKCRWGDHKKPSTWKKYTGMKIYKDMAQYGLNNFLFEIVEETTNLREREQYYIDTLRPTYNSIRALRDEEVITQYYKEYYKVHRDKSLAMTKEYYIAHKEKYQSYQKEYLSRLCFYNGETLTLDTLRRRFWRHGIPHPTQEARKYLIEA